MAQTFIQRRRSRVEVLALWIGLLLAMAVLGGLLSIDPLSLVSAPLDREAWHDFYLATERAFVRNAPIVIVLALVPPLLPERRAWRWPLLVLATLAATWLAWLANAAWWPRCGCQPMSGPSERAYLHDVLVAAAIIAVLGEYRRASVRAAETLHVSEIARVRVQGELDAGRLQLLQAQIEPHFLFNSLANVRRLLRVDGSAGRAMLVDLLRYLESALPRLREDTPTLGREVEVVRAFLGVHQVRMGARLSVDFDVPNELADRVVPPMMLITLVENALKHGLQPLHEGGSIRIAAGGDAQTLRLDVADTGRGLGTSQGAGTGLANIRARLRSMYGAAASLSLRVNEPRGVVATIIVPSLA